MSSSKQIVQKEIRVYKCNRCDEYGHVEAKDRHGGIYHPYCVCEYGEWQRDHEEKYDMFAAARRG